MGQQKKFDRQLREAKRLGRSRPEAHLAAERLYKSLTPELRMQTAREIVEARQAEYLQLFKNLVAVTVGFKIKTWGRKKQRRRQRVACVVFVVGKKWPGSASPRQMDQLLPDRLYSHVDYEGRRTLVAVPTDVIEADEIAAGHSQAWPDGVCSLKAADYENGSLCCLVELVRQTDGAMDGPYLMSCRHVFNPGQNRLLGRPKQGTPISTGRCDSQGNISGAQIGLSSNIGGGIQRATNLNQLSFDAQLAKPTNGDFSTRFTERFPLKDYFAKRADFDAHQGSGSINCKLLVPKHTLHDSGIRRSLVYARFIRYVPSTITLDYQGVPVRHLELLELEVIPPASPPNGVWGTYAGDSGSPVVVGTRLNGFKLVGMHIAGSAGIPPTGSRFLYVIPAWSLFSRFNYHNIQAGWSLRPVLS